MSKLTLVFPLATLAFLLLIFSETVPLLDGGADLLQGGGRWKRKDSFAVLLITLLYTVAAFTGLGNPYGVTSFCKFGGRGEYALIELNTPTEISSVRYYPGLYMGKYYLQFSNDGENFTDAATLEQKHADVFKWRSQTIEDSFGPVRCIRIISGGKLWLGEIAFYDGTGNLISADEMLYPEGCNPLLDEQDMIPERASYKNGTYFDEVYHARTAYEHLKNQPPYEVSHPPLGKLLISLGIRLFGMVPFGWRFSGTCIGILMLPALYFFLKKLFGGTTVFAADFMHFVQTRIATIDSYAVFFTILMYLFFWLYWRAPREKTRDWVPPLALSGLCFGLGAACKWTCIYAGGGLALLWLLDRIFRAKDFYARGAKKQYRRETSGNIFCCLFFFVIVPAAVYYLSYWRYGTAAGLRGPGMLVSQEYRDIVLSNQKYMYTYHAGVHSTHPYSSRWWQWMLDIRPILYYLDYLPDGHRISFGAWVNPMLCWGGLMAMICMVYLTFFKKDRTALFILVGYLAQLLPWMFVRRVVFEYHYFPSTVFLLLALGYIFRTAELRHPEWKRILISFTGVSVVLFFVFYPALAGLPVSRWYGTSFLKWMGTWPF